MSISGHLWALAPRWMPHDPPPQAEGWFLDLEDPRLAPVRLTGRLRHEAGSSVLLVAERDPMVPKRTLLPVLEGTGHSLSVSWIEKGGHVTFPANFHLGVKAPAGLEDQTLGGLSSQIEGGPAGPRRSRPESMHGQLSPRLSGEA